MLNLARIVFQKKKMSVHLVFHSVVSAENSWHSVKKKLNLDSSINGYMNVCI